MDDIDIVIPDLKQPLSVELLRRGGVLTTADILACPSVERPDVLLFWRWLFLTNLVREDEEPGATLDDVHTWISRRETERVGALS
jgi:hypothetical protein